MKKSIFDIIETIIFFIVLAFVGYILSFFKIKFNSLYLLLILLILWVGAKILFKRKHSSVKAEI